MNNCKCGAPIPDDHSKCTVCRQVGDYSARHPAFDGFTHVVGVDPSLTATGVVVCDELGVRRQTCIKTDASLCLEHRMSHVLSMAIGLMCGMPDWEANTSLCCIENNHVTSGRSAQSALIQRELIGVLATDLWKWGMRIVRVAPTSGKKALTGSGKATKDDMVEAACRYPGFKREKAKYVNEACADALGAALAGMEQV